MTKHEIDAKHEITDVLSAPPPPPPPPPKKKKKKKEKERKKEISRLEAGK
jgi:hypothetical protein